MNEKDKLVYETMSRKDLGFGCRVILSIEREDTEYVIGDDLYGNDTPTTINYISERELRFEQDFGDSGSNYYTYPIKNIIGHGIILSDVLKFYKSICENKFGTDIPDFEIGKIYRMWNVDFPYYENQSEECKDFIRGLIKLSSPK